MKHLHDDIEKILVSEEEIASIVKRIAEEIDRDYADSMEKLVLVCILKGSLPFMGDLMKQLSLPVEIDCMKVSSYGNSSESSGNINITLDLLRPDLGECNLLIVEDIVDSGVTLSYLTKYLALRGAKSVKTCTLLDKPSRRKVDFTPDYVGKVVPDEFVVGYGLDYAEMYRALPFVGVLKEEVYKK